MRTAAIACLLAGFASCAFAQSETSYPERSVRIVVPWAASGNVDVLTRVIAQRLTQTWGQQIIVDNRGGANGMIGTEIVVRSNPDGYTLLVDGLQTHAINPLIFNRMAYETQRDLAQITLMGAVQHILVAHPSLPVKSTKDLVALAKSRPGDITYATFGTGSMPHMAGELFQQITGTRLLEIPYKGGGPALTGMLSGEASLYWPGIAIAIPHIKTGKLQALGLASRTRSEELPNLPTLAEQLKSAEYDVTSIFSFMAPANTPRTVIAKVQASVNQALAQVDTAKRFTTLGATVPPALSPEETLAMFKAESARWSKVVKAANIKKS